MLSFSLPGLTASMARTLLMLTLQRAGAQCTQEQAGRLICSQKAMWEITNTLTKAWIDSMPEDDEEMRQVEQKRSKRSTPEREPTWMSQWASAYGNLKIPSEEWLHMTPRMVQELSRQEMERTRQREFLFSNGVSNLIVFSAHPPKRPFDSDHFMLHPWPNRGKAQDEPITGEYIMAVMAAAMPQTKSN